MTEGANASAELAELVAGGFAGGMPRRLAAEAKRALTNYFAVALAGSRDPAIEQIGQALRPFSGEATSRIVGRDFCSDMPTAAFVNCAAANVYDFDDTHFPTIMHPTAPVASALLAHAGTRRLAGATLLEALVLGIEVECRIGLAMSPYHYDHGWHITSTCSVFGAAAGVARVLGLDRRQTVAALANASATASGLVHHLGTSSKSIGVGSAARNGLLAAILAGAGVSGPADPLGGPRGFLAVFGDGDRSAEVTADLGRVWQIDRTAYKPYPCGVVLNPVIDGCLDIGGKEGFDVSRIEAIRLYGHPLLRHRTDRPDVATGRQSQVSAQHAVAVTFLRGRPGLAEFSDEAVGDPQIRALARRVSVHDDSSLATDSARIEMQMKDGTSVSHTVPHATGSLDNPLSDAALAAKLRAGAAGVLQPERIDRLLQAIGSLEQCDDVAEVLELAAPG